MPIKYLLFSPKDFEECRINDTKKRQCLANIVAEASHPILNAPVFVMLSSLYVTARLGSESFPGYHWPVSWLLRWHAGVDERMTEWLNPSFFTGSFSIFNRGALQIFQNEARLLGCSFQFGISSVYAYCPILLSCNHIPRNSLCIFACIEILMQNILNILSL